MRLTLQLRHTCTGHRAAVYALSAGLKSGQILSAGGDGWIVAWDLDDPATGRVIASLDTQVFSLLSLPDQGLVVAGNMNGGLHWIDLEQPDRTRNILHHQKGVYDLAVYDTWLYSCGGDGTLTRWRREDGRAVESFQLSNRALRTIAIAPGRQELAVGASDSAIYILDLESMALKHTLPGAHTPSVFALCFSPDQRYLLSGGRDAMLRIWDMGRLQTPVSAQPAHWFTLNCIVYSPDGRYFATASRDKTVKIWDAARFQLLKVVDTVRDGGHINSVNHLLWTDQFLVSGSDDRTIKLWATL